MEPLLVLEGTKLMILKSKDESSENSDIKEGSCKNIDTHESDYRDFKSVQ